MNLTDAEILKEIESRPVLSWKDNRSDAVYYYRVRGHEFYGPEDDNYWDVENWLHLNVGLQNKMWSEEISYDVSKGKQHCYEYYFVYEKHAILFRMFWGQ